MTPVLPLKEKVGAKIKRHGLIKKFAKQIKLLEGNPKHPSLHTELLQPKQYGIYSFRIDRKYRALFIFRPDLQALEILNITVHYQ